MSTSSRWAEGRSSGAGDHGEQYAARFAAIEAAGHDIHGEATFCTSLLPPGARILDAGCGTGRVAIRLAELGYSCIGVDSDPAMLAVAQRAAGIEWQLRDLADIEGLAHSFDLIVAAGNVMPLLASGTGGSVIVGLAGRLVPGGLLVAGFGLDAAHLPLDEAPFGLTEYDEWCAQAGLTLLDRYATWSAEPFPGETSGYAVSVHRRAG